MRGFFDPRDDTRPKRTVVRPDEYEGETALIIACTQTHLKPYRARKLVDAWCSYLPTLDRVRRVWFSSRVPQRLFDAACRMPNLESLWVKWSGAGIKNIEALAAARSLRHLHLGSSTSLASLEVLAEMPDLRWLELTSLKPSTDLGPVGALRDLDGLALEGSMWTTWRVRTLEPLSRLRRLRYLELSNLRADDNTLSHLAPLTHLEFFNCARWWPDEEIDAVYARNPKLGTRDKRRWGDADDEAAD